VTHVLRGTQDAYGVFGLVLGPIAWIYLLALVTVLAAEINVVAERRPWPRALLTSFTDRVRLTPAHERAYTGYADSERHKGFQVVDVGFEPPQEATGRTAESPGSDVQAWGASRPLRVKRAPAARMPNDIGPIWSSGSIHAGRGARLRLGRVSGDGRGPLDLLPAEPQLAAPAPAPGRALERPSCTRPSWTSPAPSSASTSSALMKQPHSKQVARRLLAAV
jgi:hypothetical protein